MKKWLRARLASKQKIGVDRDNNVINGFIVAEAGPFKDLRGEFDDDALVRIVELANESPKGLKSRFTHPSLSNDGLGKYLGRAVNARLDENDGRMAVRADLHLSDTAGPQNPNGDLRGHVMDLAEEDADAIGASLVLQVDETVRLDEKNRPLLGEDGEQLPPLWMPKSLHAVDVVDDGDATHSFLGVDSLPDSAVRFASAVLNDEFPNLTREQLTERVVAFLHRYLDERFGPEPVYTEADAKLSAYFRRQWTVDDR